MSEIDTVFNERNRRCAAVQLMFSTDPSYDNRTIASSLKMQIRRVQRLRAQLNASDDPLEVVEQRPKAKDTARRTRTNMFIGKVQAIIDETPQWPIQQIARDLGVSHITLNACVKEDLKCRSYRRQTSQILTEKTKNLSQFKSVRLPNKLKYPKKPNMVWFFSDERNLCQHQLYNSQNHRWIATNKRNVPRVMKTKFPATVMVFGVVSSKGHIMPPRIFQVGLKVNTKVNLNMLKSVVIPWWNQVATGRPWVWQQDSAPAHKSKETQAWLQKECNDFVPFSRWPPPPTTWTRWTTSFGHTSRTSPTWPATTPKPAWSPPSAEYSPSSRRRLRKRHVPSSGSVSRRWLRLKAAALNRCQLYYIIKLPELIFFNIFLKINLSCCFL